jgi:putative spermidine/putrescine transport system ATP-binding protein
VRLGNGRATVPAGPLRGLSAGAPVDLFARPEQLRIVALNDPASVQATVAAHVYQGGHVDVHADSSDAVSGRMLVRIPSHDAMHAPVGARVGIAVATAGAVAFPPD